MARRERNCPLAKKISRLFYFYFVSIWKLLQYLRNETQTCMHFLSGYAAAIFFATLLYAGSYAAPVPLRCESMPKTGYAVLLRREGHGWQLPLAAVPAARLRQPRRRLPLRRLPETAGYSRYEALFMVYDCLLWSIETHSGVSDATYHIHIREVHPAPYSLRRMLGSLLLLLLYILLYVHILLSYVMSQRGNREEEVCSEKRKISEMSHNPQRNLRGEATVASDREKREKEERNSLWYNSLKICESYAESWKPSQWRNQQSFLKIEAQGV